MQDKSKIYMFKMLFYKSPKSMWMKFCKIVI